MDGSEDIFWQQIVDAASGVVNCSTCRRASSNSLGLPQPGWVGPNYKRRNSIVFLLQNPSSSGQKRPDERPFRNSLNDFAEHPTIKTYHCYVTEMMSQVSKWGMWKHPVSKICEGLFLPDTIAWMNVVKFRTPGNEQPDFIALKHGLEKHLQEEFQILQPSVVVAVGKHARASLSRIDSREPYYFVREYIGLRCTTSEAYHLRNKLRDILKL